MEKKDIIIILIVFLTVSFVSYFAFQQLFGGRRVSLDTKRVKLENYAKQVRIDNEKLSVSEAKEIPNENNIRLLFENAEYFWDVEEQSKSDSPAPLASESSKAEEPSIDMQGIIVPEDAYETAEKTPGTVLVVRENRVKTKNPPYWMFSISIAVIISTIIGAGLLTKQELRGDAASKLLEEGLENLTVRDLEIFSQILRMGEFTIPELMQKTGTSKVTTWRTVKKLVEEGLVEETDEKKPPSKGLGGRGKPSKVYRFEE